MTAPRMRRTPDVSHGSLARWIGGALLLLLLLSACRSEEEPDRGVTLEALTDDPSAYVGQTVTISGEIQTTYGLTSFTVGGDDPGSEVLVIVPPDADIMGDPAAEANTVVHVTGIVREYVAADIEHELRIDLEPDVEYEGDHPAVVAEVIRVTTRSEPRMTPEVRNGTPDQ